MRPARHLLLGVALVLLPVMRAEGQPSPEYAVKAAYLTKFAPFIEWPDGTFASSAAPLSLCILGNDPFGSTIDKAAGAGGGGPITIRRAASADQLDGCQIVFAGDPSVSEIDALRGRPVVTVTDSGMPVAGVINFVMQDNHVRFDIDEAAAEKTGLRVSSKLLELARKVTPEVAMSGTGGRRSWPISMALAAAVLLLLAGIGMARYEDQLYAAQQTRDVSEQTGILAASVTAAVSFGDANAAQEYVDALKTNPELRAAGVYDAEGKLFAQFTRGGVLPSKMSSAELKTQGAVVNGDAMTVSAPVLQDGRAIGGVAVVSTTEPAQRRIARYAGLVLLVTMGALVIGVLAFSQAALSRRAGELAIVNGRLRNEMAERQKTEEALRQSHKMEAIGQLSGGIAHDFNNLIMISKSNLRMLLKKSPPTPQLQHYVSSAETALDRAAGLTQRILAFSRRQPLSPQPVPLSELVRGMDELLRHSVGEVVKLETILGARWWTLCDPNQMENVILNLAINARDAMPKGGTLTIETRDVTLKKAPPDVSEFVPGDYVALTVHDTGEGMSPEVRQRALDPFFTTKPQGKGTGLGLSMTFGYVRQSNGYLVIESEVGKGTAIIIYMPRQTEKKT